MKKIALVAIIGLGLFSCKNEDEKGRFKVTGNLLNTPDQKIYLEQLYFSQNNPEVLDTAEVKNGKFELSAVSTEEGLFRIRLDQLETGLILINDEKEIVVTADTKNPSLETMTYNSPVNKKLKAFLEEISKKMDETMRISHGIDSLTKLSANDSIASIEKQKLKGIDEELKGYLLNFIGNAPSPVLGMFAFGYTRNIEPTLLKKSLSDLGRKFPDHKELNSFASAYTRFLEDQNKPQPVKTGNPTVGSMAPDFTMEDVDGKPFSLSMLKGKYVLVDFWASWCAPCRGENPNIVAAYNKFKNKNFSILGVSLDEKKDAWLKAIKDDNLTWKQVSDLKGWNSASVPLYGFDGIPYNVLIDPQGKIIAVSLRGEALEEKLSELLN